MNYMAAKYQSMPVAITVEGANILTRSLIVFGQGLNRAHPNMQDIVAAIGKGDAQDEFSKHAWSLVGHGAKNAGSAFSQALVRPRGNPGGKGAAAYHEAQLQRLAAAFAVTTDLGLVLGGKLKTAEFLSGRYADILSNLYLVSRESGVGSRESRVESRESRFRGWGASEEGEPEQCWVETHTCIVHRLPPPLRSRLQPTGLRRPLVRQEEPRRGHGRGRGPRDADHPVRHRGGVPRDQRQLSHPPRRLAHAPHRVSNGLWVLQQAGGQPVGAEGVEGVQGVRRGGGRRRSAEKAKNSHKNSRNDHHSSSVSVPPYLRTSVAPFLAPPALAPRRSLSPRRLPCATSSPKASSSPRIPRTGSTRSTRRCPCASRRTRWGFPPSTFQLSPQTTLTLTLTTAQLPSIPTPPLLQTPHRTARSCASCVARSARRLPRKRSS